MHIGIISATNYTKKELDGVKQATKQANLKTLTVHDFIRNSHLSRS